MWAHNNFLVHVALFIADRVHGLDENCIKVHVCFALMLKPKLGVIFEKQYCKLQFSGHHTN